MKKVWYPVNLVFAIQAGEGMSEQGETELIDSALAEIVGVLIDGGYVRSVVPTGPYMTEDIDEKSFIQFLNTEEKGSSDDPRRT